MHFRSPRCVRGTADDDDGFVRFPIAGNTAARRGLADSFVNEPCVKQSCPNTTTPPQTGALQCIGVGLAIETIGFSASSLYGCYLLAVSGGNRPHLRLELELAPAVRERLHHDISWTAAFL